MITEKKKVGKPLRKDKDNKTIASAEKWTLPGEKRKTYIVNVDAANKIEQIARKEGKPIKAIVNDSFIYYLNNYEKINGLVRIKKPK